MKVIGDDYDLEYSYPLHMTGSASTLPESDGEDVIARLHEAVKDATGIEIHRPQKPRIGFLP